MPVAYCKILSKKIWQIVNLSKIQLVKSDGKLCPFEESSYKKSNKYVIEDTESGNLLVICVVEFASSETELKAKICDEDGQLKRFACSKRLSTGPLEIKPNNCEVDVAKAGRAADKDNRKVTEALDSKGILGIEATKRGTSKKKGRKKKNSDLNQAAADEAARKEDEKILKKCDTTVSEKSDKTLDHEAVKTSKEDLSTSHIKDSASGKVVKKSPGKIGQRGSLFLSPSKDSATGKTVKKSPGKREAMNNPVSSPGKGAKGSPAESVRHSKISPWKRSVPKERVSPVKRSIVFGDMDSSKPKKQKVEGKETGLGVQKQSQLREEERKNTFQTEMADDYEENTGPNLDGKAASGKVNCDEDVQCCGNKICESQLNLALRTLQRSDERHAALLESYNGLRKDLNEIKNLIASGPAKPVNPKTKCSLKGLTDVYPQIDKEYTVPEGKVHVGGGRIIDLVQIARLEQRDDLRGRLSGLCQLYWPGEEINRWSLSGKKGTKTVNKITTGFTSGMAQILRAMRWKKKVNLSDESVHRTLCRVLSELSSTKNKKEKKKKCEEKKEDESSSESDLETLKQKVKEKRKKCKDKKEDESSTESDSDTSVKQKGKEKQKKRQEKKEDESSEESGSDTSVKQKEKEEWKEKEEDQRNDESDSGCSGSQNGEEDDKEDEDVVRSEIDSDSSESHADK
ncbi:Halomucin [Frankliniella fusca]|uniref:Halomucin n=1 Tax=Frankliniella fusca TaxID=407009 RepID=A0AAE1LGL3_9NEOP|nr:Halomucin [Frankliniella fusca]